MSYSELLTDIGQRIRAGFEKTGEALKSVTNSSVVEIGGKKYVGNNIVIRNGVVIVDGVVQEGTVTGVVEIKVVEGVLGRLETDASVVCQDVLGDITAGGSVKSGNVGGNVSAGGSVKANDIGGGVTAGGSVNAKSRAA